MCSNWQAPIRNCISDPLPSFTSPPPTHMPDLHRGQVLGFREGNLDMVSTFSVQSLASSKDVTATVMWSLLLEVRVFIVCFLQPLGPSLWRPSRCDLGCCSSFAWAFYFLCNCLPDFFWALYYFYFSESCLCDEKKKGKNALYKKMIQLYGFRFSPEPLTGDRGDQCIVTVHQRSCGHNFFYFIFPCKMRLLYF
ncbi:hypothetical protein C1H46_033350 [Malus baccata]|uniref:Uncharacterized protein n=1 Tax=Malus baccata TaxID=106549 RepID=A0A540L3N7_MALBA|nr:hypothetical protein C1H46_033350 [Malus baccata]